MTLKDFLSFFTPVVDIKVFIPIRNDDGESVDIKEVYSGSSDNIPKELLCYNFRTVLGVYSNFVGISIER